MLLAAVTAAAPWHVAAGPAAAQASAAAAPAAVNVATVGPQPGTRVPEFTLPDHRGRQRTLASLAGPRGTMLVFSRSADW